VAKGVDVREVQTLLTLLCFNPGPIDGAWGNKTEKAAKDFFSKYSKFFKGYTSVTLLKQTYAPCKYSWKG